MKIVGIGQCCLDTLAVVGRYPERDSKAEVRSLTEQGGGPVATALVTLARLGASCDFYGIVGDDPAAGAIRESLGSEGIDIRGVMTRKGALSQTAFIAIEEGTASRTIFWRRASGPELRPHELGDDFLAGADMLLLDGLMGNVSTYAAKQAKRYRVPVLVDAGRMRKSMIEIIWDSDYLVGSEEFGHEAGYDGDAERFRTRVKDMNFPLTTITLGAKGSVTYDGDRIIGVPAFRVEAVDTTGAGDVFHGAFAFGILKQWDIETTVRFASAVAAIKCTKIGGRAGIPDLAAVSAFLAERGFPLPR